MGFQLDTSGYVGFYSADEPYTITWSDLTPFTQGYVEGMWGHHRNVWAEAKNIPLPNPENKLTIADGLNWRFSDLAPETLARIMEDCAAFQAAYPQTREPDGQRERLAGGYFWTNRNGGDYPAFPPLTPYLGDDGKVYLR